MKTNTLPKYIQTADKINIIGPCPTNIASINAELPSLLIDGGVDQIASRPHYFSLGDGDSSSKSLDLKLPIEKDMSDLSYALDSLSKKIRRLYIYGMLGKRKDHEYINLGEVYKFCERTESFAKFDENFIIIPRGKHIINIFGEFSILTINSALITVQGKARYTLDKKTELLPLSSLGLSNIGDGEVTLESDSPLIIYTEGQSLTLP